MNPYDPQYWQHTPQLQPQHFALHLLLPSDTSRYTIGRPPASKEWSTIPRILLPRTQYALSPIQGVNEAPGDVAPTLHCANSRAPSAAAPSPPFSFMLHRMGVFAPPSPSSSTLAPASAELHGSLLARALFCGGGKSCTPREEAFCPAAECSGGSSRSRFDRCPPEFFGSHNFIFSAPICISGLIKSHLNLWGF